MVNRKLGDLDQAGTLLMQALSIRETLFGPSSPSVADTLEALAFTMKDAGDATSASAYLERAKVIRGQKE